MTIKNTPEVIANKVLRYLAEHPACLLACVVLCPRTGSHHVFCEKKLTRNERFNSWDRKHDWPGCEVVGNYSAEIETTRIVDDILWFMKNH